MLMEKERGQIVAFGKRMSAQGLSKGTSGNLSCYDPETGYMAISPSGLDYFDTAPEDIVIMDLEGNIIEGTRKPSSEHNLHATVYRHRPEARAVVHTHSAYCATFACLRMPLKAVHYVICGAGVDEVPCADYATFGTPELAEAVGRAIGDSRALLLANHGLVTAGSDMAEAFSLAVNLEFVAEMQWRAMCIGAPVVLTGAEMEAVRLRMQTYGQDRGPGEPRAIGY